MPITPGLIGMMIEQVLWHVIFTKNLGFLTSYIKLCLIHGTKIIVKLGNLAKHITLTISLNKIIMMLL